MPSGMPSSARTSLFAASRLSDSFGGVHRLVSRDEHERVQRLVARLDGGQASLGEFGGLDLLRAQLVARFRDRQTVQCHGIIR